MKLANHHQMNGKKIIVHQPYYLAYPGFFHKLSLGDIFVIMDDAQYDKRFTNRNRIITNNDWMWITVPINKKHKFHLNMEVEINNEINWKELHWKKILHSYKNAPFFKKYQNFFENIYKKNWDLLFELDFEIIKKIIEWLEIKVEIIRESELNIKTSSTQRLIDVCKKVDGDIYISGIGGKNYLDEKLFESNNLKLEYQDYLHPIYPQRMSQEFIPDLSIIDMMFNIGSDSSKLIKGQISYD
jgi:hypothetical protein